MVAWAAVQGHIDLREVAHVETPLRRVDCPRRAEGLAGLDVVLRVPCPAGVQPGDALQVAGPGGQVMQVSVPAGVMGGQQFMVQMPAAPVVRAVAVPAEAVVA